MTRWNEYDGKYVTGWMKNGIAYYEEQFPDQLRTFYQGVSGYLYRIADRDDIKPVDDRENMYYSTAEVIIAETIKIDDVYEELLKYESERKLVVRRYNEQSVERQNELVDFIAQGLIRSSFFEGNKQKQEFMKKHFPKSWEKASLQK